MKIYFSSKKQISLSPMQREKIEEIIKEQVIGDCELEELDSESIVVSDDLNSFLSMETLLNNLVTLQDDALQLEEQLSSLHERNEILEEKVSWLREKAKGVEYKPQLSGKARKIGHSAEPGSLYSALTHIINRIDSGAFKSKSSAGFFLKHAKELKKDKTLVSKSGYYNQSFLVSELTKLGLEIQQPLEFFMEFGAVLELSPSDRFDTKAYLSMNPDVREAGMNPLLHYLKHGKQEGRVLI